MPRNHRSANSRAPSTRVFDRIKVEHFAILRLDGNQIIAGLAAPWRAFVQHKAGESARRNRASAVKLNYGDDHYKRPLVVDQAIN